MSRTLLSLDGLSVGDAFGERFLEQPERGEGWMDRRETPPAPWNFTDDTTMAVSIVRSLNQNGGIDQDELARAFAKEYVRDIRRGYGGTAHKILHHIWSGTPWRIAAREVFGGAGSCGNGGAMRAAPLGAYFADDIDAVIEQARASAEVTHAHPDGQTGAIAVALAAAWMVRQKKNASLPGRALLEFVLERIPQTETYGGLTSALDLAAGISPRTAAARLGNGSHIISSDTVPFCLWCAARHPHNYQEALWTAVSVGGDIDTNCAIIGGIVAISAGLDSIPLEWLKAREPFTV